MVRGVREFRDDFRDDRRRRQEDSDSRREDDRRDEMMRSMEEDRREQDELDFEQEQIEREIADRAKYTEKELAAYYKAGVGGGPPAALAMAAFLKTPPGRAIIDNRVENTYKGAARRRREKGRNSVGRQQIRRSGQFDRQNLLPRFSQPVKRTRKKTKTDKNMSKALRMANERLRKKNGSLRKGASQSQIMKLAHKLLRKM